MQREEYEKEKRKSVWERERGAEHDETKIEFDKIDLIGNYK